MADEGTTSVEKSDSDMDSSNTVPSEEKQDTKLELPNKAGTPGTTDNSSTDMESQKISFKMPSIPVVKSDGFKMPSAKSKKPFDINEKMPPAVPRKSDESGKISETIESESTVQKPKEKPAMSNLSPAEQLKQAQIAIPYKEPSWSGLPEEEYKFEVLKNGTIISTVKLDKPFLVFGRLPSCDVPMEHPSLSRHHAVVQYCKHPTEQHPKGVYLYDLDSTHGTWINKNKVYPNRYYRIRVGHVLKFGGSTRLHILQGPEEDQDQESDLSISEMKEQREKQHREAEFLRQAELAEEERQRQEKKAQEEARGCLWGMGEDAVEDEEENSFDNIITPESEALYIDDPKKALKGFFEREGYDPPEYDCQEAARGKYKCTVELPIDTPTGEPMVAEAVVSGKKREAVLQCALEACRILDRQGLLRASSHESRKRKKKNWEDDDFYDSDEDTFLDRTGDIEKKRQQRMQKAGKSQKAENYDTLLEKHQAVTKEIADIESKLEKAKAEAAALESEEVDALDAYMTAIRSGAMDTKTKMKLKRQLIELKQEEQKLRRLLNVAKPATLPDLKPVQKPGLTSLASVRPKKFAVQRKPMEEFASKIESKNEVEEEEDDNDDENLDTHKSCKPDDDKQIQERVGTNESATNIKMEIDSDSERVTSRTEKNSDLVKKEPVVKGPSLPPNVVKGPSLPPPQYSENPQTLSDRQSTGQNEKHSSESEVSQMEVESNIPSKKTAEDDQPKVKKSRRRSTKKSVESSGKGEYDPLDPDFAVWVPPENQKGDGKTYLNEKYGY